MLELVFVLDCSGSMSGLEEDTTGGFNSMIQKQKKEGNDVWVSTVLFNNQSRVIHDRLCIDQVQNITTEEYCVGGSTALLDAVGNAIHHIADIHKYARKEDVPEKTLFVITTDGMENSSHEYTYDSLKKMIEKKQEEGWEFLFLGANIDAAKEAKRFGVDEHHAVKYHSDKIGTAMNYQCLSEAVTSVRKEGKVSGKWRKAIDEDYRSRQ